MTSNDYARLPLNKHFVLIFLFLLKSASLHFYQNDVKKSEKPNSIFRYVQCCQSDFFHDFRHHRREFSWNHIFARSLRRCLNTQPAASCSDRFLRTLQMLMHEKTCDPYILVYFRVGSIYINWWTGILQHSV